MSDRFYEQLAIGSQIVASLLFIVVLVWLWFRFLAPAVAASQARKNQELIDSEKRRDEAKAAIEVAKSEVESAEADARTIVARAAADGKRLHERTLTDAGAESERLVRNAEGELERSRGAAREQLRDELLERAVKIARRAAERVDDATDRRLIGETVETVERGGGV